MEEIIMIKAGIIGATGYAGNEIVRLLLGHKDVEVARSEEHTSELQSR